MLETIRRKIFETLDRTAFKAQFSGLRAGSFNSGSGLRKIAQSAWTPPSVYRNAAVVAKMDEMAEEFPVMSRERVLAEQREDVVRSHLEALEAYRTGKKDEALAIFFQEFSSSEAGFLIPFAQDAALAASQAPRDDIIAVLRRARENMMSHEDMTRGRDLSPAEWRVVLIAHTLSHYVSLENREGLTFAAENLNEFVVGAAIADKVWNKIIDNTRYFVDPSLKEDPHAFKTAYAAARENGRDLTIPLHRHRLGEVVELGKNADLFRDKLREANEINPVQLRLGIPEAFGQSFFKDMDPRILPQSVRNIYPTPLDAFTGNGDYRRTMEFIHISVYQNLPLEDEDEADMRP